MSKDIYNFITEQEAVYIKPVQVIEGWNWGMKEQLRKNLLYKSSQFFKNNEDRDNRPFKNIIRPILNVQYRTEGFNVLDVNIYVDSKENYHKSYLLRKFHERWALIHQLDTFIDELVESYVDDGGALVKNVKGVRPEVVNLLSIAFCNQKDILSNSFGIKHYFSPDELMGMESSGWGNTKNGATISIDQLIILTREQQKKNDGDIEIYEVHGMLLENWLDSEKNESKKYVRQMQIVAFYKNENDDKIGVTLFKSRSPKKLFKLLKRDNIKNRALGFGGIEELTDAQVWSNYAMIRKKEFLDSASKTLLQTTDPSVAARHPSGLKNLDNLEIIEIAEGKTIGQIDTFPRNYQLFNNAVLEWEEHARRLGFANEPLLGEPAPSGTPFRAQERQVIEGKGTHEYRKEKIARFVEEIYREWIIPHLSKEVVKGKEFLAELDAEVLSEVAKNVSIKGSKKLGIEGVNQFIKRKLFDEDTIPSPQEIESIRQGAIERFSLGGAKRFMEMLEDDFKDSPIEVKIDIAGKNKNLDLVVEKLGNIFRTIAANPQIFQIPGMVKLFNRILEASGESPIEYSELTALANMPPMMTLNEAIPTSPRQPALIGNQNM